MYDMLRAEDESGYFPTEERPRRYKWVTVQKTPYTSQLTGDGLQGFDVLWIWKDSGFYLQINKAVGGILFKAQIPNWQMAEVEDVADALIAQIAIKDIA